MAQQLLIQNSKDLKHFHEQLREQFGYTGKLDLVFLYSEKKERYYAMTKDLANIDLSRLKVDSMGLYFASKAKEGIRLTIDATQLLGPHCTKNIVDLTRDEMQVWLHGEKLAVATLAHTLTAEPGAFVILRCTYDGITDYLGCGKIAGEFILNYIPKTRYVHADFDDVPDVPGEKLPLGHS
jgi:NOL1/NOP2/fmu family ribosome biogenesis protein